MPRFKTPSTVHTDYTNSVALDITDEDEIDLEANHCQPNVDSNGGAKKANIRNNNKSVTKQQSKVTRSASSSMFNIQSSASLSSTTDTGDSVSASSDKDVDSDVPPLLPNSCILHGIFGFSSKSYDVSLFRSYILLELIGGDMPGKSKKSSKKKNDSSKVEIQLKDLFGVAARQIKLRSDKKAVIQGLELHTYTTKENGRLKPKILYMSHPSENLNIKWEGEIRGLLKELNHCHQPKVHKFFVNHTCGTQATRAEFKDKVLPLFSFAGVGVDLTEESDMERICKEINDLDLSSTESIIIVGGDGTVHSIINMLLKKVQFDNRIVLSGSEPLLSLPCKVGIIPCDSSNTIAHTVNGADDMMTAALHILYGDTITSDILSLSNTETGLFRFAFSAHYGYGGTILDLFSQHGIDSSTHKLAITKSLSKSKLRAYECEIQYNLAPASCGKPSDENACREGCTLCKTDSATPRADESRYSGTVQEFNPLDSSNNSEQLQNLQTAGEMEATVKGEYMNVSFFATPCLDSLAPLGFSKYTHMADGCMDMVMVDKVKRKEFMKFLQRNGNKKNQLDYPYANGFRIKEAIFHSRMPAGWSFRDDNYSEIQDQASKKPPSADNSKLGLSRPDMTTIISQLDSSDDNDESETTSRLTSASTISRVTTSLSGDDEDSRASCQDVRKSSKHKKLKPGDPGYVYPNDQYTFTDKRMKKRREKELAKEMKEKVKQEKMVRSFWNVDSTRCYDLDLSIRIHPRLITFYGAPLKPDVEKEDVFCIPAV